jgi:hypothetical protein
MINQQAIHWDNLESIDTIIDKVKKKQKTIKIQNNLFEFFI